MKLYRHGDPFNGNVKRYSCLDMNQSLLFATSDPIYLGRWIAELNLDPFSDEIYQFEVSRIYDEVDEINLFIYATEYCYDPSDVIRINKISESDRGLMQASYAYSKREWNRNIQDVYLARHMHDRACDGCCYIDQVWSCRMELKHAT